MLTRRSFLKSSAVALVAGALMPAVFSRGVVAAQDAARRPPTPRRVLIVVQLKGGNDGLNAIVPYSSGHYYDARGELAIPQDNVLPLHKDTGLHPNLVALKDFWDSGNLAIVDGVGYPSPSYSHFVSMDYWRTADVREVPHSGSDGWIGRYLEHLDSSILGPVPAMNVGRSLANELRSQVVSVSTVDSVENYQFRDDRRYPHVSDVRFDALHKIFSAANGNAPVDRLFFGAFEAALAGSLAVQEAHSKYTPAVTYPDTRLARDLLLLAEAVHFNSDLRVGHVSLGGFDTHANQLEEQGALLKNFSDSVAAFWADIAAHGHADQVLIMTWSEFGRRPKANASDGTDHGSAAPMFVLGNPVAGGFYGELPSLTDLDRGNLRFTTDFRSVYATVLEQWLGAPSEGILGNRFEQLPFLHP